MGRLGELFRWVAAATGAAVLGGAQSAGDEARTSTRRADPRGDMVAVLPAQAPHPSLGHHADLFGRFVGTWDADYSFIAEAQAAGEIADNFPARDLADFLLAGWHGAMLRMKVDRSSKPLDQFKAIAFATVLARRP